jgi:hypothetical protein
MPRPFVERSSRLHDPSLAHGPRGLFPNGAWFSPRTLRSRRSAGPRRSSRTCWRRRCAGRETVRLLVAYEMRLAANVHVRRDPNSTALRERFADAACELRFLGVAQVHEKTGISRIISRIARASSASSARMRSVPASGPGRSRATRSSLMRVIPTRSVSLGDGTVALGHCTCTCSGGRGNGHGDSISCGYDCGGNFCEVLSTGVPCSN